MFGDNPFPDTMGDGRNGSVYGQTLRVLATVKLRTV